MRRVGKKKRVNRRIKNTLKTEEKRSEERVYIKKKIRK